MEITLLKTNNLQNGCLVLNKDETEFKTMNRSAEHKHQFVRGEIESIRNLINRRLIAEVMSNTVYILVGSAYTSFYLKLKFTNISTSWMVKLALRSATGIRS